MSLSSTVCMIAKNEAPYLVEWVAYHRLLGFNEVIVYENNSDDNSAVILKSLADAGKITYRPWPLFHNGMDRKFLNFPRLLLLNIKRKYYVG